MDIRHAERSADAAACAAIYAPYVRDTAISLEEDPPDAAAFARRIERITRTHPWLVAVDRGVVIGYAYGGPHHDRSAYRWAADAAVYMNPAHHRRGVGRQLYGALFGLLAKQGVQMVCAGVTLPNEASVGLHESLGFQPVGVYRRVAWKLGRWWDVGWWQLPLTYEQSERDPPAELGPPARLGKQPAGR